MRKRRYQQRQRLVMVMFQSFHYNFSFTYNLIQRISKYMFFGMGPFGIGLGYGQQPQPQQPPQQQQPQQPFFGHPQPQHNQPGFLNNLLDNFMHPFFEANPQQGNQPQQQQPQQQPRPSYFRKNQKQGKQKQNDSVSEKMQTTGYHLKKKGNQAYQKGRYEQAIDLYSKAIDSNNSESVYFSNRAQAFKKLGRMNQALNDAQEAIELDTSNARGHLVAGQCLAQMGKRDDNPKKIHSAITRLTKALTLSGGGKRLQLQKQASRYIYLAKKVLFYIQFNQIRNARLQALKQYRDYLSKDQKLDSETKQQKMKQFINASDEKIVFSIPEYLTCRITFDLMEDPVVTDSGQCYQRFAIEQHMQKNGRTDPFTRQPIKGALYPCITIKKATQQFLQRNPWAYEYSEGQNYKDIQF